MSEVRVRAHPRRGTRGVRRHYRIEMRPSPLHGRGMFALEDIPAGAEVADFSKDTVIFNSGDDFEPKERERYNRWHLRRFGILGIKPGTPPPNTDSPGMRGGRYSPDLPRTWRTQRIIRRGEELLVP